MIISFSRAPTGSLAQMLDFTKFGFELGYDRFWLPDQTFQHDPFVVLAAIAANVPRVSLGLAVTNPYTRHPAMIARAASSLAELTGNRFVLGLGAGNRKHVLNRLHIDGSKPAERLQEAIRIIRGLLAGEEVQGDGFWPMDPIQLECIPEQPPPIFIAARNPRVLQVGGGHADGVMMEGLVSPEGQAYGIAQIEKGAGMAGRPARPQHVVAWQSVVIGDPVVERENLRLWTAYLLGMTKKPVALQMGVPEEVIDGLHAAFADGGAEAAVKRLPPEMVDLVALVGEPDTLAERIHGLVAGGATEVTVQVRGDTPATRKTLRRFAEEVRPLLSV